ncbi:MAG TPA: 3-phosphoshikimate 1-carboxyvinyltransferase [Lentisphaeria bacterium]|nr:MAG: 3-phosphoshikimate 1-carboxyvinyltransferase [Lentisphaerae bacterium GWF2_38_69]HBM15718.1 3-phosphoshikimate 1-carboxyvinyltransferase [Lentisphaeria bacterium]
MDLKVSKSSLSGEIVVPGSKSHTIRAIVTALMASGTSVIKNPLISDDTESALFASKKLGAKFIDTIEDGVLTWKITGTGGKITNPNDEIIFLGNSGTSMRLLAGLVATSDLKICFDGDASLRGRLMAPLLSSIRKLGGRVSYSEGGKCPLSIKGPIIGGETIVEGKSSQFLSALLFAVPLAKKDTIIHVINLNERPYVDITVDWLKSLKIKFEYEPDYSIFRVKGNQAYKAFKKTMPADFSTALFHLIAAAVTNSKISLKGLDFADNQGDKEVFEIMKKMGMTIEDLLSKVNVFRQGALIGDREIDMNNIPDAVPIMAVAGCFAKGKTILNNAPHARIKECDRITAMARELKKMGAKIEELEDGLVIEGSDLHSARVNGHGDHRVIMALAIAGMAVEGTTIVENAGDYTVTYPNFVRDFKKLGAEIERI